MYRRILVPLDASRASQLAFHHALDLARSRPVRVRLLNVLEESSMMPAIAAYPLLGDMSFLLDSLKVSRKKILQEALELAEAHGVKAEPAVRKAGSRYVSDVILDDARKWRADLIAMGTHGRRGLGRLIMGSDAARVLLDANIPVLLVRGGRSPLPAKARFAKAGAHEAGRRGASRGRARA